MSKDKTMLYIGVAIALIAIAIVIYVVSKKGDTPNTPPGYGDGSGITDSPATPGQSRLQFHKTTSDKHHITWDLEKEYDANILSGNYRVGGWLPTDIQVFVRQHGSWKLLKNLRGVLVGAYPGTFVTFALTVNMRIDGVKWEAEQGWLLPYYIDEVHAQLTVEG